MKTTVIAKIEVKGFHYYENAPESVSFLKHEHRHIFYINVGFDVIDLDREIEIFTIENEIQKYINNTYGTPAIFNNMSCEMIAKEILIFFQNKNCKWVEVLEDNKGGAKVEL